MSYVLLPARAIEEQTKGREKNNGDKKSASGLFGDKKEIREKAGTEPSEEKPQASEPSFTQARKIEWRGQVPKDKWNLLSHRVLAKLGSTDQVSIEVTIRADVPDGGVKQQLNSAIRELGLVGEFIERD